MTGNYLRASPHHQALATGISRTALLVLKAESFANKLLPEFCDYLNKSCQIADALECDFSRIHLSADDVLSVAIRKKMIVDQIRAFVDRYPQGIVVNLGCGLSSFYEEFEGSDIIWFDLDLPELICTKRKFFEESANYRLIGHSVLDYSWMGRIPKDRPTLFIMEGVLPYFCESEVRNLLQELTRQFPKQESIIHAISKWRVVRPHNELKKSGVGMSWGVASGKVIASWIPKLRLVEEQYPYALSTPKWSFKMRFLRLLPAIRRMDKILRYASI